MQRLRNRFTLLSIASFVFGVGMTIVSALLPNTGWEWPTKEWYQRLTIAGFVLIGLSVVLFIWGLLRTLTPRNLKSGSKEPGGQSGIDDYVSTTIVDSKLPAVLDITNTLQEMAKQQNIVMMEALNKQRASARLAFRLQGQLQKRLNIRPNYAFPTLSEAKKQESIVKEIKKAGLYKRDFDESHVQYLLAIEWVLDDNNKGLSSRLEQNSLYKELKDKLSTQMSKVSGKVSVDSITTYLDICLAMNSLILYTHYFPKRYMNQLPPQVSKPVSEIKHNRDIILSMLLQRTRKIIEDELHGRNA